MNRCRESDAPSRCQYPRAVGVTAGYLPFDKCAFYGPAMPRSPLPLVAREALAEQLTRRGEIAVCAAIGTAPATLRRARRGERLNATTAHAITDFLTAEAHGALELLAA